MHSHNSFPSSLMVGALLLGLGACDDVTDSPDPMSEQELITTVELGFVDGLGAESLYRWADPELDGDPVVDPILLPTGEAYTVFVRFLDEVQQPAEDVTIEVLDESDAHQVFFTGQGLRGPAAGDDPTASLGHGYADEDANGLPVGLENTVEALAVGTGMLTITLRHLPAEDGQPVKTAGLAAAVALDGFGAIPGDTDVQVTFPFEVE